MVLKESDNNILINFEKNINTSAVTYMNLLISTSISDGDSIINLNCTSKVKIGHANSYEEGIIKLDISKYDAFHARFFGRVSELLLDIWINTNNLKYKEVKIIDMEKINWMKKGFSFLKAKFINTKYEKSF